MFRFKYTFLVYPATVGCLLARHTHLSLWTLAPEGVPFWCGAHVQFPPPPYEVTEWVGCSLLASLPFPRARLFFILFVLSPRCAPVKQSHGRLLAQAYTVSCLIGSAPPSLRSPASIPFCSLPSFTSLPPFSLTSLAYLPPAWCQESSSSLLSLNFCVCVCHTIKLTKYSS